MITIINNLISPEVSAELYSVLRKDIKSWHNQRPNSTPPHMLGMNPEDEIKPRKLLASSISNESALLMRDIASLHCGYELENFNSDFVNFFKYETGAELGVHRDTRPANELNGHDKFSTVIFYINDDFSGGKFNVFSDSGDIVASISPSSGDVVITNNSVLHESASVTTGNKYIGVMHWFNRKYEE